MKKIKEDTRNCIRISLTNNNTPIGTIEHAKYLEEANQKVYWTQDLASLPVFSFSSDFYDLNQVTIQKDLIPLFDEIKEIKIKENKQAADFHNLAAIFYISFFLKSGAILRYLFAKDLKNNSLCADNFYLSVTIKKQLKVE